MATDALGFEIVEGPAQAATVERDAMGFEIASPDRYDELGFEIVPTPLLTKLKDKTAITAGKVVDNLAKPAYALNQGIVGSGVGAGKAVARLSDPGPRPNSYRQHEREMLLAGELDTTPEKAATILDLDRDLTRSRLTAPGEAFSQGAKEAAGEFEQLRNQTPGFEAPAKGAEMVGGLLPFVAEAAVPVVGPALAAAHGGASVGGDVWQQAFDYYRKQGLSEEDATKKADEIGGKAGAANAALFTALPGPGAKSAAAIVGERLASRPVAQALVRTGMSGTQAGAIMAADKVQQLLEAKDTYRPELTVEEGLREVGETFVSGVAAGALIHGPQELAKLPKKGDEAGGAKGKPPKGGGDKPPPAEPPEGGKGKPTPPPAGTPAPGRVSITDELLANINDSMVRNQVAKGAGIADSQAPIAETKAKAEPTEPQKGAESAEAPADKAAAAQDILDQAVAVEAKDHPEIARSNPEVLPQIVADELKADPKAYAKDLSPEDQARLQQELAAELGQVETKPAEAATEAAPDATIEPQTATVEPQKGAEGAKAEQVVGEAIRAEYGKHPPTADSQAPIAETKPAPAAARRGGFLVREREDGVPDILDAIQDQGGLQPLDAKIYGNWRDKVRGVARLLVRKGGRPADLLVDDLNGKKLGTGGRARAGTEQEQVFRIETVDDLLEAIDQAVGQREQLRSQRGGPEAQFDRFWEAATKPGSTAGLRKVNAQDLHVGDKFRLRYPGASHEELEVRHIDPDTGEVQVKDGPMFGTRELPDGAEIWVQSKGAKIGSEGRPVEFLEERETPPPSGQPVAKNARPGATGEEIFGGNRPNTPNKPNSPEAEAGRLERFEKWLDKAIDATKPDSGLHEGVTGAPVWATKASLHALLKVVRAALQRGRSLAESIHQGIAWMRQHHPFEGFNDEELGDWLWAASAREFPEEFGQQASAAVRAAAERATAAHTQISELKQRGEKVPPELREAARQADAEMKAARQQLLARPEYVESLIKRLEAARAAEPGDERAGTIESLQAELEQAPAASVNQAYRRLQRPIDEVTAVPQAEAGTPVPVAEARRRAEARVPETVRPVFRWANRMLEKLVAMYRAGPNRDRVAVLKDAADNTAMIFGKRTSNAIRHELNRAFGAKTLAEIEARNELREGALTMVVEAGAGATGAEAPRVLQELARQRETLAQSDNSRSKWTRKALAAIAFAEEHLDRLMPIAQQYARLTDAQNMAENQSGYRTLYRQGGYVFHTQDVNEHSVFPEMSGGGGGAPAPFRHARDHATYADSIAAGLSPQSLSAVDLLHRRMTMGRRMMNYGAWIDSLREIIDPSTRHDAHGGALVTDLDIRIRADGSEDIRAPVGYFMANFGGREVAVHKGYEGIFNAMTAGSWLNKGVLGRGIAQGTGLAKHFLLFFDTFHLGRLAFWNSITRGGLPTYQRGLTLIDSPAADIQRMVERGEVPAEWGRRLMETKYQIDGLLQNGLNVGSVSDNLHAHLVQKLPVVGKFNKWLFERYQRGAMVEVALREIERLQKNRRDLSEVQMWRMVARDINTRFGSLNSQSWIRSKTGQGLARIIFLAPQWNEALIRSELGALRDAAGFVKGLPQGKFQMGTMGRAVGTAALGMFIANQVINYLTRGHPTWENPEEEEGAKISAWIPDAAGGPGFFINPMGIPTEITHLLWKNTEKTDSFLEALRRFTLGRGNNLSRPLYVLFAKRDAFGRALRQDEVLSEMFEAALPLPLSGSAVYRLGKQVVTGEHEEAFAGQFQKQAMQTFGLKTDSAPSPEQRIRALAHEWRKHQPNYKENPEFYRGDYSDLVHALQMGNMRDAATALDELRGKKKEEKIEDYFDYYEDHPYTGSRTKEAVFIKTLNPEQKRTYDRARDSRKALAEKFRRLAKLHKPAEISQ